MFNVDRLEEGGIQGWASGMPVTEVPRRSRHVTAVSFVDTPTLGAESSRVTIRVETERTLRSV